MNAKHWMLLGVCAVVISGVVYVTGFKSLPFLLVLLCPLMHLFMMGDHSGHSYGTEKGKKCH